MHAPTVDLTKKPLPVSLDKPATPLPALGPMWHGMLMSNHLDDLRMFLFLRF